MNKKLDGFEVVESPFTIDGIYVPCRVLNSRTRQHMYDRRMFTTCWDNDVCEVSMIRYEKSEYEVEDKYYIYYFED